MPRGEDRRGTCTVGLWWRHGRHPAAWPLAPRSVNALAACAGNGRSYKLQPTFSPDKQHYSALADSGPDPTAILAGLTCPSAWRREGPRIFNTNGKGSRFTCLLPGEEGSCQPPGPTCQDWGRLSVHNGDEELYHGLDHIHVEVAPQVAEDLKRQRGGAEEGTQGPGHLRAHKTIDEDPEPQD